MDASQVTSNPGTQYKKGGGSRRVWSVPEELALIDALKELVVNGWRADNSFRPGYLTHLEVEMAKKFPNCNLRGQRHINSKLTVWKKTYSQLKDICNTSGPSFDYNTNMVEQSANDICEGYVKVHPDVQGFQNKRFPYFNDWKIIFGNDRATGAGAEQITDAILDLEHPHKVYDVVYDEHVKNGGKGKGVCASKCNGKSSNETIDLDSEYSENEISTPCSSRLPKSVKIEPGTKGAPKKRKRLPNAVPENIMKMIGGYFTESNNTLQEMASKITTNTAGQQQAPLPTPVVEPPSKTKIVFDMVAATGILPIELRISVAHKIIHNPLDTELFITMDDLCRAKYIDMIVAGNI